MLDDMRTGLKSAMKQRDRVAVAALRSALAAVDNAGAVPVDDTAEAGTGNAHVAGSVGLGAGETARRHLTDADVRAVVAAEVRERNSAAEEYERLGQTETAERLRAEAEVLNRHLAG
ncbi:GatB/YqeY domain-containing protein [Stackebrandtia albiflava]|nr:GatB/YqeY domain-containing protein [Stackebrandtia albiflava]